MRCWPWCIKESQKKKKKESGFGGYKSHWRWDGVGMKLGGNTKNFLLWCFSTCPRGPSGLELEKWQAWKMRNRFGTCYSQLEHRKPQTQFFLDPVTFSLVQMPVFHTFPSVQGLQVSTSVCQEGQLYQTGTQVIITRVFMSGTCPSFPSKIWWGQVSWLWVPHPWGFREGRALIVGGMSTQAVWPEGTVLGIWKERCESPFKQRISFHSRKIGRQITLTWKDFLFTEPLCCKPCLSEGKRNQGVPKQDPESQTSTPHFANSADWDSLSSKSQNLTLLNHKR